ncbi:MAG TPA: CpsB/CapC family capsule biosynthesis tyrosine phosphatase [Gaiellaceae bacterium]|nr:CpsB/CapC family capsule biosynthesis tyrosine phosphatase [Gaiellaceae bacterium]
MIDLHSHVLPAIDDGVTSLAASLELLRAAHEDGIERIAATPHVRDDYPTSPGDMERLVREVNEAARAEGIGVEVLPGGELDLAFAAKLDDEDLRRFGLGGNPALLLLEFPYLGWPLGLPDLVFTLRLRGFGVVIAHPERNVDVQVEPERLRPLVDAGAFVQVTAASLDGRLGGRSRSTGMRLVEEGLAHVIASDAHAPDVRSVGMSDAADVVGDEALARWLTDSVPAALVEGRPPPERPETRRRGLLRRR